MSLVLKLRLKDDLKPNKLKDNYLTDLILINYKEMLLEDFKI